MEQEDKVYPAEEQGIEPKNADEDARLRMETGQKDEEVYEEKGREQLLEDDEIGAREAAFMAGAEGKGELGVCAACNKPLNQNREEIIERRIDGELCQFCCDNCAERGPASKGG